MASDAPPPPLAANCCHCGTGIAFLQYFFLCTYCNLRFCVDCNSEHPATHTSKLKWIIAENTQRGSAPINKLCKKCTQPSHCGIRCNDCDLFVCSGCSVDYSSIWSDHQHRAVVDVRCPDDAVAPVTNTSCYGCTTSGSLAHCSRCQESIVENQPFVECLSCRSIYNGAVTLCGSCSGVGQAGHDPKHRFVQYMFRVDLREPNNDSFVFGCRECGVKIKDGNTMIKHSHGNGQRKFDLIISQGQRLGLARVNFRSCSRRPVRDIALLNPDLVHNGNAPRKLRCESCLDVYMKNMKTYRCALCFFHACARCYEFGPAKTHGHTMYPAYLREITIPEDLHKSHSSAVRTCDQCNGRFAANFQDHLQCADCNDFNVCHDCIEKARIGRDMLRLWHNKGKNCSVPEMHYFDPIPRDRDWWNQQAELVKEERGDEEGGERPNSNLINGNDSPQTQQSQDKSSEHPGLALFWQEVKRLNRGVNRSTDPPSRGSSRNDDMVSGVNSPATSVKGAT